MKKVLFSVLMVGALTSVFAQNNKVLTAYNYMQYDDELDKAKAAIDEASTHDQTATKSKTWMYRGHIYAKIAGSEQFNTLHENPQLEAVNSYLKAFEYDTKKIDVNELKQGLASSSTAIVNQGIALYNSKDYKNAGKAFDAGIKGFANFNITDSLSYYYGAVSAKQAGNNEKAIKYFQKCITIGYAGALPYNNLVDIYTKSGDAEAQKKAIAEGRVKFPDDSGLLTAEINLFLQDGDAVKALSSLNEAIAADPENITLLYARGNMHEKAGNTKSEAGDAAGSKTDYTNAKADYTKAIALDPNYFDANYNMGALIFNEAVKMMSVINEIKDNAKYSEEKKKADAVFLTSIPYLEKAHEIDPNDVSTMQSLKQLYVRSGDTEKYEAIKEKLEN